MNKTYNGRFPSPPEPKSGGKWLLGGLLMIPFWSIPALGVGVLAGSVCCFVKAGKMGAERRMHRRFHEYCAVIGMRTRVPFRELAKAGEMSKNEVRQYLQKMIARGYFGGEAYLDVNREELVLPAPKGYADTGAHGGWRDIVMDLIGALRGDARYAHPAPRAAHRAGTVRQETAPEPVAEPMKDPMEEPVEEPVERPEEKLEAKPAPKAARETGRNYMGELEKTLNELYQLNEQIADEEVSRRIDRIGALTACIFRAVIDNPGREQDVRKFMNYYLPTTLKLLKSYDMLENQSYQGENIVASRKKIENVLDMLIEAYERQLDRLFSNDALDIATDIDVLETMMAGDGLSSRGQMKMM